MWSVKFSDLKTARIMMAAKFSTVAILLLAHWTSADDSNNHTISTTKHDTVRGSGDSPPGLSPNTHVELEAKCRQSSERGNGSTPMFRFFFDPSDGMCRQFVYSGDGGNENNFQTELDCLNDCYTGVSEGAPVSEEDIVFIGQTPDPDDVAGGLINAPAAVADCRLPKQPGNCTGAVQSFYFIPEWQSCVAFVYSGCGGNANRFKSRVECEQRCLVQDGGVCRGPSEAVEPLRLGANCTSTDCPPESTCVMGAHGPECCNADEHVAMTLANAPKCENGARAGGWLGEYFVATFAQDCADLICGLGERCRVGSDGVFAKCCKETVGQSQKPTKTAKPAAQIFNEMRV